MKEAKVFAVDSRTGEKITEFSDWKSADAWKNSFSENVASLYELRSMLRGRLLREGLAKGDLTDILVPQVSVDEYKAREDNDNIVIAFFVHNVPEAIEPLRRFCDRCPGVVDTDSGDSDTLRNTSIVYCEFKRKEPKVDRICRMVELVAQIANLKPSELNISFPNAKKLYPFSKEALLAYFSSILIKDIKQKQDNKALKEKKLIDENNLGIKFWFNEYHDDNEILSDKDFNNQHHYIAVKQNPERYGLRSLPQQKHGEDNLEYVARVVFEMLEIGWVRGTVQFSVNDDMSISLEANSLRGAFQAAKWVVNTYKFKVSRIDVDIRTTEKLTSMVSKSFKSLEAFRQVVSGQKQTISV